MQNHLETGEAAIVDAFNPLYDKVLQHATHDNVVLRRRAYSMLLELFAQRGEHAISSLNAGAMGVMVKSLTDEDESAGGAAPHRPRRWRLRPRHVVGARPAHRRCRR